MSLLRRLLGVGAARREAPPEPPAPPPAPPAVPVHVVGSPPAMPPAPALLTGGAVGLTPRDMDRLRGVHPDLVRVVIRARSMEPFFVAEGLRTRKRQAQLVAEGKSRTQNSRHLTGHAVDLYPISGTPIPQMTRADYEPVARAMQRAAAIEAVPLTVAHFAWGWDSPHYELPRGYYPA